MNKPVCLGLSILELSKMIIHQFWYDYVKLKCGGTAQLCYMDSFISKADDVYRDIAGDVETRFDTSNQEFYRPSPKYKNKKLIGLTKDELRGKIMIKFMGRRAKTCIYLTDDGSEDKKTKVTKKCAMKS